MSVTAEIVRGVVVVLLAVTFGVTGGVMRLHYRAFQASRAGFGLLPAHVFVISVAQLCFLVGAAFGILDNEDSPLSYKFYLYIAGCVLTLTALFIIGKFQKAKLAEAQSRREAKE